MGGTLRRYDFAAVVLQHGLATLRAVQVRLPLSSSGQTVHAVGRRGNNNECMLQGHRRANDACQLTDGDTTIIL